MPGSHASPIVCKGQSVSRQNLSIAGGLFGRIAAPAVAALMLASCQTTAQENASQGDAAPVETADAAAPKRSPSKTPAKGYTDPLVVSAAASGAVPAGHTQTSPAGDGAVAAYAPGPAPADLGELTLQPTAVNASRNSLFSQAPAAAAEAPAPATAANAAPADAQAAALPDSGPGSSPSIVVPSELPTREVNPMRKSLFSAELRQPQPAVVEEAYLPPEAEGETPVYASGETPIYEDTASAAEPVEDTGQQVAQAAPVSAADPAEPEQPKKRKWLASLKAMFGKKKD